MRGLAIALVCQLWFALAHPSSVAEGAYGDLRFDADAEVVAGVELAGWLDAVTPEGVPIRPADCLCTLLLYKGAALAAAAPVAQQTLAPGQPRLAFRVTFLEGGDYTVVVLGRPRPGAPFGPFRLEFPITALALS